MEDRKLPDWIDGYLKFTSQDEPRETFRSFTAISTIAAALQTDILRSTITSKYYTGELGEV